MGAVRSTRVKLQGAWLGPALSLCREFTSGGKRESSSLRATCPPARTCTPRLQCVRQAVGKNHLRRLLGAPSHRGSQQEEARRARRRVVALEIGYSHSQIRVGCFGDASESGAIALLRCCPTPQPPAVSTSDILGPIRQRRSHPCHPEIIK